MANRWIWCNPVALRVIEDLIRGQVAVALGYRAGCMQTDLIRLLHAKGRVIGLDARAPDVAIIRAEQQIGVCIHRQV